MKPVSRRSPGDRRSFFIGSGFILAAVYACIIAVPIYFVVVSGFKDNASIFGSPMGFPNAPTLANFRQAFHVAHLLRAFLISVMVTVAAEGITIALTFPAAYAIARFRVRASSWLTSFFSLGFLIPTLPLLLSTFLLAVHFGLLYNPLMLIFFYPATRVPFSILFLIPFIRSVPASLEESAAMDGASRFRIMTSIFIPLATGGIVNVLILNFIYFWNEYIFALVILNTANQTLQVAIASLSADMLHLNYGLIAAGLVVASLPVFILFYLFQERVMSGVTAGALKA